MLPVITTAPPETSAATVASSPGKSLSATMQSYKNHPIRGGAISGPGMLWRLRGFVFGAGRPMRAIKDVECPDVICTSSKEAEHYALTLCKAWIDRHKTH